MNLGFWITWFRYQKLKIFSFEYLTWGQKILPREGYSPSSRGWFEGFFLDQGLNQKLLKWGIELKKDIESWRGGWIIINDRIFSTPNKENETLQLHPPSDFFPFFAANSCCFSFIIMPEFWSCNHVFSCLIWKGAAGPMEGKKIATPSSKTGKKSDVKHQHKIRILQLLFAFFLLQISRDLRHRINALNLS